MWAERAQPLDSISRAAALRTSKLANSSVKSTMAKGPTGGKQALPCLPSKRSACVNRTNRNRYQALGNSALIDCIDNDAPLTAFRRTCEGAGHGQLSRRLSFSIGTSRNQWYEAKGADQARRGVGCLQGPEIGEAIMGMETSRAQCDCGESRLRNRQGSRRHALPDRQLVLID